MKKVAIVMDRMIYGGISKVGINYLKLLPKDKYLIDLIIMDPNIEDIIHEVPDWINVKVIRYSRFLCPESWWKIAIWYKGGVILYPLIYAFFYLLNAFYRMRLSYFKEYDVAIAFSGHYNDLSFVLRQLKCQRKISWLHGALYQYILSSPAYVKLYGKFDKNIAISSFLNYEVFLCNKSIKNNFEVIYNPILVNDRIDYDKVMKLKHLYGDFMIMVARIDMDKDHENLINAMEYLKINYGFNKNLLLLGDGRKTEYIRELIKKKGLEENIHILGNVDDTQNYYAASYLLVHSGLAEAFGAVYVEAMNFNIPILSTDSLPGSKEVLGNDEYGKLVPVGDSKALAEAIYRFYTESDFYKEYKEKSDIGKSRFAIPKIRQQFMDILDE